MYIAESVTVRSLMDGRRWDDDDMRRLSLARRLCCSYSSSEYSESESDSDSDSDSDEDHAPGIFDWAGSCRAGFMRAD